MRIVVGANKRGVDIRDHVIRLLRDSGHEVEETRGTEREATEYPDIAARAAQRVQQHQADRGILIGRTGMGMCIVANRFSGVRAAVCFDEFMAEMSRRYLDVNVLCLSADLMDREQAERLVETWVNTPFEGGHHARRIERIAELERDALADHLKGEGTG